MPEPRQPAFPREKVFRETYSAAAYGIVAEYLKLVPRFPPGAAIWVSLPRAKARHGNKPMSDVMAAVKRMAKDGVFIAETFVDRTGIRVTGWHPEKVPRMPSLEPKKGDAYILPLKPKSDAPAGNGRWTVAAVNKMSISVEQDGAAVALTHLQWRARLKKSRGVIK